MGLDLTKPVQTVGGMPARIICTDRANGTGKPVVALFMDGRGVERSMLYSTDGVANHNNLKYKLVNVPEHRFSNVYPTGFGSIHPSKRSAFEASRGVGMLKDLTGILEQTEDRKFVAFHDTETLKKEFGEDERS